MSLGRSAKATRGITIFVLALALSASLTACGSDAPTGASPNAERAASTSTPERAAATPDSTDTTAVSTTETTQESTDAAECPKPPSASGVTLRPDETSPETDREALVALYNATDGPDWDNNDNWLSDSPIGEWEGVNTDAQGRVVFLGLRATRLSGEIPPELGNLTSLGGLTLASNQLSGEIPPELCNLTSLVGLGLSNNQLSGEIPPELGNLASLERLWLFGNQLSGEIPPELGNLTNLSNLYLEDNQLSGEIPPELGNLTNLYSLRLSDNQLSGCVPAVLSHAYEGDLSVCE